MIDKSGPRPFQFRRGQHGLWPKGQPARHPGPPSSFYPRSSLLHAEAPTRRASTAYSCPHPYSCLTCSCMKTAYSCQLLARRPTTYTCQLRRAPHCSKSRRDAGQLNPLLRDRALLTVVTGHRVVVRAADCARLLRTGSGCACGGGCSGAASATVAGGCIPLRGRRRDDLHAACVSRQRSMI